MKARAGETEKDTSDRSCADQVEATYAMQHIQTKLKVGDVISVEMPDKHVLRAWQPKRYSRKLAYQCSNEATLFDDVGEAVVAAVEPAPTQQHIFRVMHPTPNNQRFIWSQGLQIPAATIALQPATSTATQVDDEALQMALDINDVADLGSTCLFGASDLLLLPRERLDVAVRIWPQSSVFKYDLGPLPSDIEKHVAQRLLEELCAVANAKQFDVVPIEHSRHGAEEKQACLLRWSEQGFAERILHSAERDLWRLTRVGLRHLGATVTFQGPTSALASRDVEIQQMTTWELAGHLCDMGWERVIAPKRQGLPPRLQHQWRGH